MLTKSPDPDSIQTNSLLTRVRAISGHSEGPERGAPASRYTRMTERTLSRASRAWSRKGGCEKALRKAPSCFGAGFWAGRKAEIAI